MVERSEHALRLLLPRASQPELRRARHLTTFLRLLSNDAQPAAARSVPVTLERARTEMEQLVSRAARRAVADLFHQHVAAATPPDSFAWCGPSRAEPQRAWSTLESLRGEFPELPGVPAPGETAASVAGRLRASAEALGADAATLELWDAYLLRVAAGPGAAEASFRRLARRRNASAAVARAAVAGAAECLLDRGAVRAARTWLEEELARVGPGAGRAGEPGAARAQLLLGWVRLLAGEPPGDAPDAPWPGRIPRPLVELRERRPEWLPWLSGRAPGDALEELAAADADDSPARDAFGATSLVLVARRDDQDAVVRADVAPGLRPRLGPWLRERRGAAGAATELEHRALVTGAPAVAHRGDGGPLEGCLDPDARSAAVVPLEAVDGAVLGWARLELDHHLLPSLARLRGAAAAWARALEAPAPAGDAPADVGEDPCAGVFRALVEELGLKTRERRWWGLRVDGEHLRLAAEGGEGLAPLEREPAGRALERARAARGPVVHGAGRPGEALHPDAAGGVVVPLCARGRLQGMLAVESRRRRDFRAADVERLALAARRHALALAAARFALWHRERHGVAPYFEGDERRAWWAPVLSFAGSRRAVLVSGPAGAGKQVVARWLHFAGDAGAGPCVTWSCAPGSDAAAPLVARPADARGSPWRRAAEGTLVLRRVERLDADAQLALAERLRTPGPVHPVRVVATTGSAADDAARLLPELRRELEQLALDVPALASRRGEIPGLVERFALEAADEERLPRPRWDEDACAALWRQPWPDNVRELEALVHRVVLLAQGGAVGVELLEQGAGRSGPLLRRLPSRRPERRDVEAALDATRTRGGRWNKTRAASLLGWDPDTLAARLRDLGLAEGSEP